MSQRADRGDRVPPARAPIAMLARARFVGIALAMTLSASCATPRSRLSVAPSWRGDFETGDSSQWSYILNPRGLSVVAAPVAEGRRAARVEIRPGDLWPNGLNRVELEHKPEPATVAEGKASFFAWSFFVPVALSEARHQIGYWESYPSYKQLMAFEVRGTTLAFVTRLPAEHVHVTAPGLVSPNRWHRVAMHVVWSTDPAIGFVDVWFDGTKIVDHGSARTLWDNPNFVHVGILRDVPEPTEVMFLDAAVEGESLDAVAAPLPAAKP